jgi:hypothetical protein
MVSSAAKIAKTGRRQSNQHPGKQKSLRRVVSSGVRVFAFRRSSKDASGRTASSFLHLFCGKAAPALSSCFAGRRGEHRAEEQIAIVG